MSDTQSQFDLQYARMPLIAILRGLNPRDAVTVGEELVSNGIYLIEVPLNSPEPFRSIESLAKALEGRAMIGAGTVLKADSIPSIADAGGRLVVSPNTDTSVIKAACRHGMISLPGSFTPTECLAALDAGAHALKLFPGDLVTPASSSSLLAILPPQTRAILVGGVTAKSISDWNNAPISGFGAGSCLFRPGIAHQEVGARALELSNAVSQWLNHRRSTAMQTK